MRKLLLLLIALASIAFGVCSLASADSCTNAFGYQGIGTGCNSVIASGGGARSYTYQGGQTSNVSGSTATFTAPLGTADPSRLVIVGLVIQNNPTPLSMTCGATSLSQIATDPSGGGTYIFAGNVTSGTSCTLTVTCTSCGSDDVDIAVWTALNLTSNTAVHGTGGDCANVTFSVTAGDYWFAVGHTGGTTGNFSGSTQSPTAETIITGANGVTMIPADMTIASTNASFSNAYSNCDKFSLATWH
jgi:hypothetical protein